MNIGSRSITHWLFCFSCVLSGGVFVTACSGTPDKDDTQVVEEIQLSETERIAEETGLSVEAVDNFQRAVVELKRADPDQAKIIEHLERAVALEDTFAEAHYNLGLVYAQLSRHRDAVGHFVKAREYDPDVPNYTVALAQAYATTEQYADAEQLFTEVVARDPMNLTAKNNLAVIALKRGDDERAMNFVREVLREENENVGALNSLGLVYHRRGNLSLAKYVLAKALRVEENNVDVLNNLGLVYMAEDNVPAAVRSFGQAIEADPDYLESRLNLGAILLEYLDYDRAHEHFANAVRVAPNHCVARLGHGASSYAKSEHEAAAEAYKFYIATCDKDHVSSHQRLAKLYETHLADPAQAVGYYKKLMTMPASTEEKAEYNAMIGFLEGQIKQNAQKKPEEEE